MCTAHFFSQCSVWLENRCDVIDGWNPEDTGSSIPDQLELMDELMGDTKTRRVAVIQAGWNQSVDQDGHCWERGTKGGDGHRGRRAELFRSELGFLSIEIRDDGTEPEVRGRYQGQQRREAGHGQRSQQGVKLASRCFGFLNEMRKVCSRRKLESG